MIMMKNFLMLLMLHACFCLSSQDISRNDLKKISWIEGSWKGLDGDTPFYEIYRMANDSTLEIISYEWNGTDSTRSSRTLLRWNKDAFYLGDRMNWKATKLDKGSIFMIPVRNASNEILWEFKNRNLWDATIKTAKSTKVYHMERISRFSPAK